MHINFLDFIFYQYASFNKSMKWLWKKRLTWQMKGKFYPSISSSLRKPECSMHTSIYILTYTCTFRKLTVWNKKHGKMWFTKVGYNQKKENLNWIICVCYRLMLDNLRVKLHLNWKISLSKKYVVIFWIFI